MNCFRKTRDGFNMDCQRDGVQQLLLRSDVVWIVGRRCCDKQPARSTRSPIRSKTILWLQSTSSCDARFFDRLRNRQKQDSSVASYRLRSLHRHAFSFLHPAEAVHGDFGCISPTDVVLMLSNSGSREEIVRLLPFVSRKIGWLDRHHKRWKQPSRESRTLPSCCRRPRGMPTQSRT